MRSFCAMIWEKQTRPTPSGCLRPSSAKRATRLIKRYGQRTTASLTFPSGPQSIQDDYHVDALLQDRAKGGIDEAKGGKDHRDPGQTHPYPDSLPGNMQYPASQPDYVSQPEHVGR